jgi:3-phenylpropionate/cinnamic acid dioxygenase small subunit
VRIGGRSGDKLEVQANFAIYRFRRTAETQYVGRYEICLDVRGPREFVMTRRSAILDHYDLADSGVVSIIL